MDSLEGDLNALLLNCATETQKAHVSAFGVWVIEQKAVDCFVCGGLGHPAKHCSVKTAILKNVHNDRRRSWLWGRANSNIAIENRDEFC